MNVEEFEKNGKREQIRGNMDISEDTKRGLYIKVSPYLNEIDDHWIYTTDLEQVNLKLTNTL